MSLTDRIAGYSDCVSLFEAALASRKGARATFESRSEAYYFSMRMHRARALLRTAGRNEFDDFMVRIRYKDDVYYVYVEKSSVEIEQLTSD